MQTTGPSGETLDGSHDTQLSSHHDTRLTTLSGPASSVTSVSFDVLKSLPYFVSNLVDPNYISSVMKDFGRLVQLGCYSTYENICEVIVPLNPILQEMQTSRIVGTRQGRSG